MKNLNIISALVENNYSILARITSMFARRGFNIESLTVATDWDRRFLRITISTFLDEDELKTLVIQGEKLEEVISMEILDDGNIIKREIALIKLNTKGVVLGEIKEMSEIFGARIVSLKQNNTVVEISGTPKRVNDFISMIDKYKIINISRSGITAIKE